MTRLTSTLFSHSFAISGGKHSSLESEIPPNLICCQQSRTEPEKQRPNVKNESSLSSFFFTRCKHQDSRRIVLDALKPSTHRPGRTSRIIDNTKQMNEARNRTTNPKLNNHKIASNSMCSPTSTG
uniref:Uncharacterized protein n=1 Tax=Arundo donax TaxID=35708 RepID=A0A0A9GJN7_ARUDO